MSIDKIILSLSNRGLVATVRRSWWKIEDIFWDFRHSVATRRFVPVDELGLEGEDQAQAHAYETPRIGHLRDVLKAVPREKRHHLIDFGCGLGRVLILARAYGYAGSTGVELSATLCVEGRKNLSRAGRRLSTGTEILSLDAAEYAIPSTANVFYFYNPFEPPVLEKVLDNIEISLEQTPREVWILYVNAIHLQTMLARRWLVETGRVTSQGYNSVVLHCADLREAEAEI